MARKRGKQSVPEETSEAKAQRRESYLFPETHIHCSGPVGEVSVKSHKPH